MTVLLDEVPLQASVEVEPAEAEKPVCFRLKTEIASTRGKCEVGVPVDQRKLFEAYWDGPDLVFMERARIGGDGKPEPEQAPDLKSTIEGLRKLSPEDLQTLAAEIGVKWDKKTSAETMLERLATKQLEAK